MVLRSLTFSRLSLSGTLHHSPTFLLSLVPFCLSCTQGGSDHERVMGENGALSAYVDSYDVQAASACAVNLDAAMDRGLVLPELNFIAFSNDDDF